MKHKIPLEEAIMKSLLVSAFVGILVAFTGRAAAGRLTDQPLVDSQWLKDDLGNESLVVLDIRDKVKDADPYVESHVPGAISSRYTYFGWRAPVNGVPFMLPPKDYIQKLIQSRGVDNDGRSVCRPDGAKAA